MLSSDLLLCDRSHAARDDQRYYNVIQLRRIKNQSHAFTSESSDTENCLSSLFYSFQSVLLFLLLFVCSTHIYCFTLNTHKAEQYFVLEVHDKQVVYKAEI